MADKQGAYYQQLWGLSECYDLVKEYEQKTNIRYVLLIRARPDSVLSNVPKTLLPSHRSTIIIPDELHSGGYNDRFAVGRISLMEKYMRRWHNLSACHIQNLHPEAFLKLFLNRFGVKVQAMTNLSYLQKPHDHGQCH